MIVNATPAAPVVTSPVTYCQTYTASELSATGSNLLWYTTATGGIGSSSALTPSTSSAGNTSYYVSQTVNGCESPRSLISVTVNPTPSAVITPVGSTTVDKGQTVTLNANSGSGLTYQWFKNNVFLTSQTNSSYVTGNTGAYTVIVSNSFGCSATSQPVVVNIISSVKVSVSATGPTTICEPDSVLLTATFNASYNYQWMIDGFTIPNADGSTYYATISGSYFVIANEGTDTAYSDTINIVVNQVHVTLTQNGTVNLCKGADVTLQSHADKGDTYQWYNGSNNITGANDSDYTANSTGKYVVEVTNSCGNAFSDTANVIVHQLPVVQLTYNLGPVANDTVTCLPYNSNLIVNLDAGSGYSDYNWFYWLPFRKHYL